MAKLFRRISDLLKGPPRAAAAPVRSPLYELPLDDEPPPVPAPRPVAPPVARSAPLMREPSVPREPEVATEPFVPSEPASG